MDSPIGRATFQAATLNAISNILAQCITAYRANRSILSSFNPTDFIHFLLFSLIACPPNYLWQAWLEGQFPGYVQKLSPTEKEALVDHAISGKSSGVTAPDGGLRKRGAEQGAMTENSTPSNPAGAAVGAEKKLNKTNTIIKWTLDQTFGAAANTVLFIVGIALLRGQSFAVIQQKLKDEFWPLLFAGQRLWPLVSLLQFTVVPFEYRTLVGSCVGLVWGVYLSLMSST